MKLEPVLLNPEYQDPVLFVSIPQKAEVVLFDLGYCFRLKIKDIQKISRIFISHTHIDHFIGFDHILRLSVDLDKTISLYGPPGFIKNIAGKLSGYMWNLKESVNLNFTAYEIHLDKILKAEFKGQEGYVNNETPEEIPYDGASPIAKTDDYSVYAVTLQHQMPVLGYRLNAADSYNADKKAITSLGLTSGKWVGELKELVSQNPSADETITIDDKTYPVNDLAKKIIKSNKGTVIVYVVDTIFNKATAKLLKNFVKQADYFFCECAYITPEKDLARQNYHMTAKQAATIALEGEASVLIPFHFSRRYEGKYHLIYEEAGGVFPRVKKAKKYQSG